jgi:hypothetical protein
MILLPFGQSVSTVQFKVSGYTGCGKTRDGVMAATLGRHKPNALNAHMAA